jgi:hypothetical protein
MSTLVKKVTSAVAIGAVVLTATAPMTGVSAAYTNMEAANKLAMMNVIADKSANPADYRLGDTVLRIEALKVMMNLSDRTVDQ